MDDNNKNMVFTVETKGNCFLCLQHIVEEGEEKREEEQVGGTVSLKFLTRYLNLDTRQVFNISSVSFNSSVLENAQIVVPVCDDCLVLTNQFSSLYEQLDLVKMKLNACVQNIRDVMVQAEETGFQVEYRRRTMMTLNPVDIINLEIGHNLRKEILNKGSIQLQQSFPKVKLARLTSKKITEYLRTTYKCDLCKKTMTAGSFSAHARYHTGDKTAKCHVCETGFRSNGDLIKHKLSVHKEIYFKTCKDSRLSNDNFKDVVNEVFDNFQFQKMADEYCCPFCDTKNSMKWKSELVRHIIRYHKANFSPMIMAAQSKYITRTHGDKLTSCDLCGTGFKFTSDLRRHKMTVHKEIFFKTCKDSRLTADKFKAAVNEAFSNFQFQKIDKKYCCPFCKPNSIALQKSELAPHIIRYHKSEFFPMIMAAQSKYITGNIDDDDDAAVNFGKWASSSLQKQAKTSDTHRPCKYCNLSCHRKNIQNHIYTRHPEQLFYHYKTPQVTKSEFQKVVHNAINSFLPSDSDRSRDKDHKCQLCIRKFARRRGLKDHLIQAHFQVVASALKNIGDGDCSEIIISDDEDEPMIPFDSLVPNSTTVTSLEPSTDTFLFDTILPHDIDNISEDGILPSPNLTMTNVTKPSSCSVEIGKIDAVNFTHQLELLENENANKGIDACNFCMKIGKAWDVHLHIFEDHWAAILSKFMDLTDNEEDSETKLRKLVRSFVNGLSATNDRINCHICETTFYSLNDAELHILQDHINNGEWKKFMEELKMKENSDVDRVVDDNCKREATPEHLTVDNFLFDAMFPDDNAEVCLGIVGNEAMDQGEGEDHGSSDILKQDLERGDGPSLK